MATVTKTKFGPADHGAELNYDEFVSADYESGFEYELINGRLYVSPAPDWPENYLETWLRNRLQSYSNAHGDVINYVAARARVFITGRPETTCPEPDIAAYSDAPLELPTREVKWQDLSPILVVEVMTGDVWKDLRRNVELYLEAESIREYWVVRKYPFGSTFTTKLLPGFKFVIDPRRNP